MNVKELKELLESLPDDMEVILQKDSEGNGYDSLRGGDSDCVYEIDKFGDQYVWDMEWSAYDAGMEEDEWEEVKNKPRVLILYP